MNEPHKHGCHNRPPIKRGYWVGGRVLCSPSNDTKMIDVFKYIPHKMSTDCQHTKHHPEDPACNGCTWRTPDHDDRPVQETPA